MTLDLTPLEKGVSQLEKSLAYLDSDLARQDQGLREQFRAAAIQAAEFTYEIGEIGGRSKVCEIGGRSKVYQVLPGVSGTPTRGRRCTGTISPGT